MPPETARFRMVTPPTEVFEPQVGWTYVLRPCRRLGYLKLELVELPSAEPFDVIFDVEIPAIYLGQHFEEVRDA